MSAYARARELNPADAYRLWAPTYADETAVSALENRIVLSVTPDVAGRRLLDVGCGTGRRSGPLRARLALAVGVDLVPEMLLAGRRVDDSSLLAAGDVRSLPVRSAAFDLVWCRLVLGHVADVTAAYRELWRVSRPGADLVVSDFHAAAVAAGHSRTFRDAVGVVHRIQHHTHSRVDHERAAMAAGWSVARTIEAPAGEPERAFYERAGRLQQFEAEAALPLVLVVCLHR